MRSITKYYCEHCGSEYATCEEALACEHTHLEPFTPLLFYLHDKAQYMQKEPIPRMIYVPFKTGDKTYSVFAFQRFAQVENGNPILDDFLEEVNRDSWWSGQEVAS